MVEQSIKFDIRKLTEAYDKERGESKAMHFSSSLQLHWVSVMPECNLRTYRIILCSNLYLVRSHSSRLLQRDEFDPGC